MLRKTCGPALVAVPESGAPASPAPLFAAVAAIVRAGEGQLNGVVSLLRSSLVQVNALFTLGFSPPSGLAVPSEQFSELEGLERFDQESVGVSAYNLAAFFMV
jgi:hypothetical protein